MVVIVDMSSSGLGGFTLAGNAGVDVAFNWRINDIITGAGGNDIIIGGAGNDNITGGANNDSLTEVL